MDRDFDPGRPAPLNMNMRDNERALTAQPIGPWAYQPESIEEVKPQVKIDWGGFWRSIKERRWRILLLAVVPTILAALYANSVQPVYRSTATLLIESGKAKILSIEEVYNGASQDREYYQTQVEILRSRDVALRTVIATRLWDEPEFDPRKPIRSIQGQIKDFLVPPSEPATWTQQLLAEATVGKFLQAVSIEPVRLSQLVRISFDARDPVLAAKMADAVGINYIESDRDARLKLNLSVTSQLTERLTQLRDKLLQSEQELQKYRETAGLVSVSGAQGISSQQMSEISQRLISAQVRRTELESTANQLSRVTNGDYSAIPAVVNSPGLMQAQNRVSLASLRLDELTNNYGDASPRVIEARASLATAQKQLQAQTRAVVSSLRAEAQAARDTERSLQAALASSRSDVQGVNRQEFQLGVLEREVQSNKQLYELLLSRTKETSVSTNLQSAIARIVDPASPASSPLRPNKSQIVLVTLILSLTSGALLFILIDRFKNTVQGSEEAEMRLRQPVLATLPQVRPGLGQSVTRLFLEDPDSIHADGIRAARTSMLLSDLATAHKTILVTSALAGEGKTMFSTNFAFAHAQTKRTLLIDCDLRNPRIGSQLGLPDDAKGLTNMVFGDGDHKDCMHVIYGSSLLVMPAGNIPVRPEEFLLSMAFQNVLKSLASRVDIVLIDSPPVTLSSDALILSQQVNQTIFVVKARDTPHDLALRSLERLRKAGADILGLVLNNMDAKESWSFRRPPRDDRSDRAEEPRALADATEATY